ncbi:MAG: glycosyltransferase family 4 protein [Deltaproteobacteria bacterium]|nr:glycosyltransferase family 4 protein [Deltaproteobacteria bacterium]
MNIGFVSDAISERMVGVGRYAKNVFLHLVLMGENPIPVDWRYDESFLAIMGEHVSSPLVISNPWPAAKNLLWHFSLLGKMSKRADSLDIVFDPSQFLHPFGHLKIPLVYVVHDISFINYPECHRRGKKTLFQLFFKDTLQKADCIVCVSHYTGNELLKYFPVNHDKISVIYEAADECFRPTSNELELGRVRQKYGLPQDFLLYVGTIEPRKNLDRLLQAYHILGDRIPFPLYIGGKVGWRSASLFRLHENLDLQDRINFLGYVPDDDLPALYNLATAFIFISKDEGFGLPPLEAMQCGTPVVISNAGSLPEIAGDAALIIDPDDPRAIGETLEKICNDKALQNGLKEKGLKRSAEFSWENTARELTFLFRRLTGKT